MAIEQSNLLEGENRFFDNMRQYSNKHSKTKEGSIKLNAALQGDLCMWWKNNNLSTLYNSRKYSGMRNNFGVREPLGGPILNTYNTLYDDFPFWDLAPPRKAKPIKSKENFNPPAVKDESIKFKEHLKEHNKDKGNGIGFIFFILILILIVAVPTLIMCNKKITN